MRKKIILSLISLTLVLCLTLCGCGGNSKETKIDNTVEDKENLWIMTSTGGYGTEWLEELAKAFEAKHEGVTVHIEVVPSTSSQMTESLKKWETNDYDIYFLGSSTVAMAETLRTAWDGKQALKDLTYLYNSQIPGEDMTLGEKVNRSQALFSQAEGRMTEDTSDDVYYGIPYFTGSMGLYYNKTVIDNALGEGKWSIPNTSDELIELCKKLKEHDVHFLMPGGMDGYSRSLFMTWWAQYEGYENFLKFYEGLGYDPSKDREVENSNYIFSQPGRKASMETSYELLCYENGYSLPNSVEINVGVLNEYQSRFFVPKNKLAFYPCGSWLPNELISDSGIQYDSDVRMMKAPIISSIIDSTDSYSGSDDKRLPNITSDEVLSKVVDYVDRNGQLPTGVTEEEAEIIRQARRITACIAGNGGVVVPAYSNAKTLADEFLLFMASDEGIKIAKEHSYGSFMAYDYQYEGLDDIESSIEEVCRDAVFVDDVEYQELFYRGGVSGVVGVQNNSLDTLFCAPNSMTGTEVFNQIVETYSGSTWDGILNLVQ